MAAMLWTALWVVLAARAAAGELTVRVTDGAGKPLEGAVVSVEGVALSTAASEAVMDQNGMEFKPHVLAVRAGARVRFPNKDGVQHEIYSFSKAKRFELPLAKDTAAEPVAFDQPGVVKLGCNIHDWMSGYIVVIGHPYFGVTGPDGAARFSAPQGRRRLTVWSETLKGSGEAPGGEVDVTAAPASLTVSLKGGKPFSPRSRSGSASQYK